MTGQPEPRSINELHAVNALCSSCTLPLVIIGGVAACIDCDVVTRWPRYWFD